MSSQLTQRRDESVIFTISQGAYVLKIVGHSSGADIFRILMAGMYLLELTPQLVLGFVKVDYWLDLHLRMVDGMSALG